ncbi:MAG: hypothetical protein ACT4O4_02125 [Nitrospiraceae bacterium]
MHPTTSASNETIGVRGKLARPCAHSRVVDEVRDADGITTGRLVCLECHAEFPDPAPMRAHH